METLFRSPRRRVRVVRHSGDFTFVRCADLEDYKEVGLTLHRACLQGSRDGDPDDTERPPQKGQPPNDDGTWRQGEATEGILKACTRQSPSNFLRRMKQGAHAIRTSNYQSAVLYYKLALCESPKEAAEVLRSLFVIYPSFRRMEHSGHYLKNAKQVLAQQPGPDFRRGVESDPAISTAIFTASDMGPSAAPSKLHKINVKYVQAAAKRMPLDESSRDPTKGGNEKEMNEEPKFVEAAARMLVCMARAVWSRRRPGRLLREPPAGEGEMGREEEWNYSKGIPSGRCRRSSPRKGLNPILMKRR
ncbi:unnamed protein product [Phytomonas sp. Hart1]|nr:unnamed protein product [Phytomonas sp. Hart1]|eukprot:CCW68756.1 unnamed protein product [Phytomonas sp. isolate Hart1]